MENKEDKNKDKHADYEHNNIEKPQNKNVPEYNSSTEHRGGNELPAVENLNLQDGLKDPLKKAKNKDSDNSTTKNDESLYGENTKTDLGGGQRDKDEDQDEKIIRT